MKLKKTLATWKESSDKPVQCIKKQRCHFADKGLYSQSYGFSRSHVWIWEWDHKEGWQPKNWCFWIVMLEKTLESPLDRKGIKSVNPKGNQSWIFIRRTYAEALILWPPDVKSWLTGKDPDAGKDWRWEGKGQQRWDGWRASLTQWTWIRANSGRQWRTGEPDVLQSMRLPRVRHDWATNTFVFLVFPVVT